MRLLLCCRLQCIEYLCTVPVVYQIYLVIYRRAGVEPPTYAQFRQLIKATMLENLPGRGKYEDF